MLDITLILFTLLVALVVRSEPLRRLRPLTLPLVLTAAAALCDLVANTLAFDDAVIRWTEGALLLAIGFLIARGCLMLLFDWVLIRRMGVTPPRLVREVVALVVYLLLAVILLRIVGVEVTGLIATSAIITVVVGLALQQTLGNLLAGLALAWEQRLVTGTWIELDGQVGLIEETGWRSLVVRTRVGNRVLVPNFDVGASRVTILGSGERAVAVSVRLGVAYGVPPDAAKAVIESVAADIPGVVSDPPPKILTSEFADSAVVYECRLWTREPWCRDDLTNELLTRAHAALSRAGMEIPFPQRTIHRAPRREPVDSRDRHLQALRACDLFGDIAEDALVVLADCSRLRRFAPGEAVVRSGDQSTALYVVAFGEGVVELGDRVIGNVSQGDFFGEAAFLTGSPRIATVRATKGHLEVVEIDDASLRSLLESHSNLTDQLAEKMAARRLAGESLRDESGALISPVGLAAQFRKHLLRIVGLSKS